MSEVTLRSTGLYPLRGLIGAALENQERILRAGIVRAEARIAAFEASFGVDSGEFVRRYENDEWEESLESIEWLGELRMLDRLKEKRAALQDITIAN